MPRIGATASEEKEEVEGVQRGREKKSKRGELERIRIQGTYGWISKIPSNPKTATQINDTHLLYHTVPRYLTMPTYLPSILCPLYNQVDTYPIRVNTYLYYTAPREKKTPNLTPSLYADPLHPALPRSPFFLFPPLSPTNQSANPHIPHAQTTRKGEEKKKIQTTRRAQRFRNQMFFFSGTWLLNGIGGGVRWCEEKRVWFFFCIVKKKKAPLRNEQRNEEKKLVPRRIPRSSRTLPSLPTAYTRVTYLRVSDVL
ncbi:hypothetical protein F4810DRAFT_205529 [Camillea tinctor]|nr:hypothetical protein F4810DRAFT_205529 [Camillea tinctor]